MIQKEFKTLKDEELCYVQGGGMICTLYMYHPPVLVKIGGSMHPALKFYI